MKANELMPGDWIRVSRLNKNGKVYRIDYANGKGNGFVAAIGGDFHEDDIEPILLTPEILEKNGYERSLMWHNYERTYGEYIVNVQLGYANKIDYVKIREGGKDDIVPSEKTLLYLPHISYIHELQHALRLVGIEKEIEP